jgi:hypothetical protein
MSVPSSNSLLSEIKKNLDSSMKKKDGSITDELEKMLRDVCDNIANQWDDWAGSVKFGGSTVVGLGVGAWAGAGTGGSFSKTIEINIPPTFDTDGSNKLAKYLSGNITDAFNQWINSYTFAGIAYSGTSTATPTSPGTFNAQNAPAPLTTGIATKFSTLASAVESQLGFEGGSIISKLLKAIETGLMTKFEEWRSSSMITSNTVSGTAVVTTGSGTGSSSNDGVIA